MPFFFLLFLQKLFRRKCKMDIPKAVELKRKGRRTNLTTGRKKFKRRSPQLCPHCGQERASTREEDLRNKEERNVVTNLPGSSTQSTQVTPLKYVSGSNQTEEVSSTASSSCYCSMSSSFSLPSTYPTSDEEENENQSVVSTGKTLPKLFSNLHTNGVLETLSDVLHENGQEKDFSSLLTNISNGRIDPQNICWLLNIHLARLTSVETTTLMRWDESVVEFFAVIYILFGASAINVLRGPMNFCDLVMESTEKGLYDPLKARINLPIPSVTRLRSLSTGYPKQIPAGLVEHSLDIAEVAAQRGSQYILSFDGKMVAKGFKGDTYGDIDLWGIEKPISINSALRLAKENIETAKKIHTKLSIPKIFSHAQNLHSLLSQLSRRIQTLRKRINGEHYLRLKIVKLAHNKDMDRRKQFAYRMQLSYLNEHSARCDSNIGRCLDVNFRILRALCTTRRNSEIFCESKLVHLHEQENAYHLFSAERNSLFFDLCARENSDIVKQRSDAWFSLRKNVKVTGSTLFNALGLESLAELKQHHYQFVKKREKPPFSEEIQKRLVYGRDNEKHAIATVVGGLLGAFKPPCYCFQEVGLSGSDFLSKLYGIFVFSGRGGTSPPDARKLSSSTIAMAFLTTG